MAKKQLVKDNAGTAVATVAESTSTALETFNSTPTIPGRNEGHPYVTIQNSKSKRYTEIRDECGAEEGDAVLVENGSYIKLDPFNFSLLCEKLYSGRFRDDGELIEAVTVETDGFTEVILAGIIVHLEDRIVPATISLKSGYRGAILDCIKGIEKCQTSEWVNKSPEHKEAAKIPIARLRGYCTASTSFRTARSSGRKYGVTKGTFKPLPIGMGNLVLKDMDSLNKSLASLKDRFNEMWSEVESKM